MEGDSRRNASSLATVISIHSLRMEGDFFQPFLGGNILYFNPLPPHGGRRLATVKRLTPRKFQSTPSAWRETCHTYQRSARCNISIHSLRMEGDWSVVPLSPTVGYFNPLPPHGGRHGLSTGLRQQFYFNPLPPHGGRRGCFTA